MGELYNYNYNCNVLLDYYSMKGIVQELQRALTYGVVPFFLPGDNISTIRYAMSLLVHCFITKILIKINNISNYKYFNIENEINKINYHYETNKNKNNHCDLSILFIKCHIKHSNKTKYL